MHAEVCVAPCSDDFIMSMTIKQWVPTSCVLRCAASGRGVRQSPFHQQLLEHGCVFVESHGFERPGWFVAEAGNDNGGSALGHPDGCMVQQQHPGADAAGRVLGAAGYGAGLGIGLAPPSWGWPAWG
jgi:hypothetical protein